MTKFTLQNVIFKTFILLKNNVKFSKINIKDSNSFIITCDRNQVVIDLPLVLYFSLYLQILR